MDLVLTLCDAGDKVVMFAPYYFNAYMSFQMTGVTDIMVGPGDPETLYPDAGKKLKDENIHVTDDRLIVLSHFPSPIGITFWIWVLVSLQIMEDPKDMEIL